MSPKMARFAEEYILDLNATQAAIRAGYSAKTAYSAGERLLRDVEVSAAVQKSKERRAAKLEITQDRVLLEIARIALLDPQAFYNADGSLKPVQELDKDTAATITSVEVEEDIVTIDGETKITGRTKKLKMADKVAALTLAARHLGMLTDKIDLKAAVTLNGLGARMQERARLKGKK